jgi:hypothetical protein
MSQLVPILGLYLAGSLVGASTAAPQAGASAAAPEARRPEKTSVRFKLTNTSGQLIRAAYVSKSDTSRWGPNLLKEPLQPDQTIVLHTRTGCGTYDIRLVAENRSEFFEEDVDFCDDDDDMNVGRHELKRHRHRDTSASTGSEERQ